MINYSHHDNKHIIHPLIIDSFLFHHIIMNTRSFTSYLSVVQVSLTIPQ